MDLDRDKSLPCKSKLSEIRRKSGGSLNLILYTLITQEIPYNDALASETQAA